MIQYLSQAILSTCAYGLVAYAWWKYLRRPQSDGCPDPNFRLLLTFTLTWAQIFSVILALGLTGLLYRPLALAINFGITGCVLWFARRPGDDFPGLTLSSSLAVVRLRKTPATVALAVALGVIVLGSFTLMNITYPNGSYDDFVYHVPSAAYFVQHHSFNLIDVAPVQEGINYATKLSELLCVWQYFVAGDDGLIQFWALGMFAQYLIAVYGLCREFGSGTRGAVFGTFLSAVAPVLLFQMLSAQNDLAMCAFFATSLRFAVATRRGLLQRLAVAISAGLLLSSKLSAPLLCAIVFVAFWIVEMRRPDRRLAGIARATALIGAIAILMGGWWYLRNAREFRNPFYPYDARVGGFGMYGQISRSAEMNMLNPELAALPLPIRLWRLWREEKSHYGLWLYNTDSAYAGFGPVFFVLGLPSLAAACFLTLAERRWVAAAVLWMIACAYLIFAGNIAPRLSLFILPGVAVGIALMITAMDRAYSRFGTAIRVLGLCLAAYTFAAAAMSPFDPVSIRGQLLTPRKKDLVDGTFLVAFAPVRTAIPLNATVAYDESTAFVWPLWRSDWGNRVEFIPSSAGWDKWRARAAVLGVTHVVLGRPGPSMMDQWVLKYPERFRSIAAGRFGVLYAYRQ